MSVLPAWYVRLVYPLKYSSEIGAAARRNGLNPALVAAVVYKESAFDAATTSPAGAVGLMQVLPSTAEEIARQSGGKEYVLRDLQRPGVNVLYGSYYLRRLLDRYGGNRLGHRRLQRRADERRPLGGCGAAGGPTVRRARYPVRRDARLRCGGRAPAGDLRPCLRRPAGGALTPPDAARVVRPVQGDSVATASRQRWAADRDTSMRLRSSGKVRAQCTNRRGHAMVAGAEDITVRFFASFKDIFRLKEAAGSAPTRLRPSTRRWTTCAPRGSVAAECSPTRVSFSPTSWSLSTVAISSSWRISPRRCAAATS